MSFKCPYDMCRAMTLSASALGIASLLGAGAYVVYCNVASRRLRRMRRSLFGALGRGGDEHRFWMEFSQFVVVVVVSLPVAPLPPPLWGSRRSDVLFEPRTTMFFLLHGVVACSWHALQQQSGCFVTSIDVATFMLFCLYWFNYASMRFVDASNVALAAAAAAAAAAACAVACCVFSWLGAYCMAFEGIVRLCLDADHVLSERAARKRRIERHAFLSSSSDGSIVHLHHVHQDESCFVLSVTLVDKRRPLMAVVSFVDVSVDQSLTTTNTPTAASHQPPEHAKVVLALQLLRSALSTVPTSAPFAELLSRAAGEALAGQHNNVNERRARAQRLIRRAWTEAVTNPEHPACIRRLRHEAEEMSETLSRV